MVKKHELVFFLLVFLGALWSFPSFSRGDGRVWQPYILDYQGPTMSESQPDPSDPNPFLDFRFHAIFVGPEGQVYDVPGFFAGNGNGVGQGNVWRVIFTPDQAGTWTYYTFFDQGSNIALGESDFVEGIISENTIWSSDHNPYLVTEPVTVTDNAVLTLSDGVRIYFFKGAKLNTSGGGKIVTSGSNVRMMPMESDGTFFVAERDSVAPGFLSKGRLVNDGTYYLKCEGDGSHWIKGGTDSPENFLAYSGFDDTTPSHHYSPDNGIYNGIYGAVDYLASKHVNSIYMLLMNIGGDGQDVYPYLRDRIDPAGSGSDDNIHFDISKLFQWDELFEYCQEKGIHLYFVLGEGEKANKFELDNATLGTERKLFYREMVARFGYHNAVTWNLCEEYDYPYPQYAISPDRIKSWAGYIKGIDPYEHPVTVHSFYKGLNGGWEEFWGDKRFGVVSQQFVSEDDYAKKVEYVRQQTASSGWKIPIWLDETLRVSVNLSENLCDLITLRCGLERIRKSVIYPVYYSGGQLELILGGLLWVEDFSLYDQAWDYMWFARKSLEGLDVASMEPHPDYVSGPTLKELCFTNGSNYALYLPEGGECQLNLAGGTFLMRLYNPRTGEYEEGYETCIDGGGTKEIDCPAGSDWVVRLDKE